MATPLLSGVAFITGGASGIGKATAYALVQNGVTKLALADVNSEAAKTVAADITAHFQQQSHPTDPITILPLPLDVTQEPSIDAAISATITAFSRLDYSINCAGITDALLPSHTHPTPQWDNLISINLRGVWLSSRAAIRQMLTQQPLHPSSTRHNKGVIVNVASILGLVGTLNAPAYTASKHAVIGMTRADALCYAKDNVRINAVCPGYVETPLLMNVVDEATVEGIKALTPLGRLGTAEEVADCIVFLCSPMSSFMHGATLVADGGFTAQ